MIRYGHIAWRVAAVAAFAGTAALAVTLTRAPAGPQAALSKIACSTSGLQARLGLDARSGTGTRATTQSTAGTYFTLEFTNVSQHACRLYGYPQVSAYAASELTRAQSAEVESTGSQRAGGRIGSAAIPDTAIRPQPVTLPPGATAHALLQVASTTGHTQAACAQVMARELVVIAPDQGRSRSGGTVFAVRIPVCLASGHASLTVQPVLARPGIPSRTMP